MNKYVELFDSVAPIIVAILSFLGISVPAGIKLLRMRNANIKNGAFYKKMRYQEEVVPMTKETIASICDELYRKNHKVLYDVNVMQFYFDKGISSFGDKIMTNMIYSTVPETLDIFKDKEVADHQFAQHFIEAVNLGVSRFDSKYLDKPEFKAHLDGNGIGEVCMFVVGTSEKLAVCMFLTFFKDADPTLTDLILTQSYNASERLQRVLKKTLPK